MVPIRVVSSSPKLFLGNPLRVTGRDLFEQKVVLWVGDKTDSPVGSGTLYASMAPRVAAPTEHDLVAVTRADQADSNPAGLLS